MFKPSKELVKRRDGRKDCVCVTERGKKNQLTSLKPWPGNRDAPLLQNESSWISLNIVPER